MNFECQRCGHIFNLKSDLKRHLTKIKPCREIISNHTQKECMLMFNDEKFLKISVLKEQLFSKDEKVKLLEKQLEDKQKENEKLKKENEKLKAKAVLISNTTGVASIGDNNHNVNINITLNSFDKTDYTVLKDNIHECIKDGIVDEAKLIKLLHFNKKHPENHNIKITNKRENKIKIYDGKEFKESNYKGRDGIWDFSQDTIKKVGNQNFIGEDETFEAIEDTKHENYKINKYNKFKKVNKIETILHNGNKATN
jgi:hypothetical protein